GVWERGLSNSGGFFKERGGGKGGRKEEGTGGICLSRRCKGRCAREFQLCDPGRQQPARLRTCVIEKVLDPPRSPALAQRCLCLSPRTRAVHPKRIPSRAQHKSTTERSVRSLRSCGPCHSAKKAQDTENREKG